MVSRSDAGISSPNQALDIIEAISGNDMERIASIIG